MIKLFLSRFSRFSLLSLLSFLVLILSGCLKSERMIVKELGKSVSNLEGRYYAKNSDGNDIGIVFFNEIEDNLFEAKFPDENGYIFYVSALNSNYFIGQVVSYYEPDSSKSDWKGVIVIGKIESNQLTISLTEECKNQNLPEKHGIVVVDSDTITDATITDIPSLASFENFIQDCINNNLTDELLQFRGTKLKSHIQQPHR